MNFDLKKEDLLKLTEGKKKYLQLITTIALNYRLDLDDLCVLCKLERNPEIYNLLFNALKDANFNDHQITRSLEFLFFYDQPVKYNVHEQMDREHFCNYCNALDNLKKYKQIYNSTNKEELEAILGEKIDKSFEQAKKYALQNIMFNVQKINYKLGKVKKNIIATSSMSDEDFNVICNYRLIYALSRETFCDAFGAVSTATLFRREQSLKDSKLKKKIENLNDFYTSVYPKKNYNSKRYL